jgi:AcrR family transcriptional regulator
MVSKVRERYREELRRTILAAARDAFGRGGYESVSMRSLAEALGVSHGSIYVYFKDKDEIFEVLVKESFDQLAAALRQIGGKRGDPVQFLKRAGRKYVEFGLQNPSAYEFAFMLRRPGGTDEPHVAYEYLRAAVKRCIDAKRFRIRDVDAASQALWAAVHGVTALLIVRPSFPWARQKTLIGRVVDSAVDGLLR